jgi:hypothetical protein
MGCLFRRYHRLFSWWPGGGIGGPAAQVLVCGVLVKPPRVKGAPLALECKVFKIFPSADGLNNIVWGEVVNFYVRDDLYINGRIDFGAIAPVGRLAAEYTMVNNTFVPPLEADMLAERANKRMTRLDGKGGEYSPIDTGTWSPSGAVIE